MNKAENENINNIEVGEFDKKIYIKVIGSGNFKNSSPLKDFVYLMRKREFCDFILDLDTCSSMDSTFMGVLAGMAIMLKNDCKKTLSLINVNSHNQNLLSTLGIDKFVHIESQKFGGMPALESIADTKTPKKKLAKNMLEAHETLMSISEENRIKFQDVYEFLQKEI